MSSTFSGDKGWYYEAKRHLSEELRLNLISKKQYDDKMEMLERERREDSFY